MRSVKKISYVMLYDPGNTFTKTLELHTLFETGKTEVIETEHQKLTVKVIKFEYTGYAPYYRVTFEVIEAVDK